MSTLDKAEAATERRARMEDVAKLAGVSAMTVSRALKNPKVVTPETLRRIEDAVKNVGYVPNRVAGNLASRYSNLVGMIVPSLRNSLFAETIQGVADILGHDYDLLIANSGYSLKGEENAVAAFLSQRICGIVLHNTKHTPNTLRMIRDARIACVETGNLVSSPIDTCVGFSNFEAARAMITYLARKNYRRIGFVSLPLKDNDRAAERKAGYLRGLEEHGLPVDQGIILEAPPGLRNGAAALGKLLDENHRVDSVFLTGDVLGSGALLEANRRGLRVPEDIAIVGSDDNELHENVNPPMTAIRFPRYEIGRSAANILIDRVTAKSSGGAVIDLGFKIMERSSA